jgi:hypothetical protein
MEDEIKRRYISNFFKIDIVIILHSFYRMKMMLYFNYFLTKHKNKLSNKKFKKWK